MALNGLATALIGSDNSAEAVDHCNEAIRLNPGYRDAYNYRGISYLQLGQYEQAIADFNKAIGINQTYADAYYHRAICFLQLGEHQSALEDFDRTLHLKPDDADAFVNRGVIYVNQNLFEPGCSDIRKARKLETVKHWKLPGPEYYALEFLFNEDTLL